MTQEKALTVLKTGATVFLTGEPGAGKTHTINQYTAWCRDKGVRYAVTASTGIAATHINGTTIHSFCGIGIKDKITEQDLRNIEAKSYVVNNILNCDVLIIDEISMLDANTLDNIERILSYIRKTTLQGLAFGGIQMIFVGDFYQLPPVSKKTKAEFAFNSNAWKFANPVTCYLTEQHRQSDKVFLDILNGIREGTITQEQKKILLANNVKEIPRTKLYTHNSDVDDINHHELKKIKSEEFTFNMTSSGNDFLVETLKKNCLSPETLIIKEGALVMFIRNNFDEGYVNGTLGTIIGLDYEGDPVVQTKQGDRITVKRAKWSIGEGKGEKASIHQYPLRLAWAVTIHKSQGMSLDSAAIDLSKSFEYGQGYVAISRVCSLGGLFIEGMNAHALLMHPEVIAQDKMFRISSDEQDKKY